MMASCMLYGCGGGGSSPAPTPTPTPTPVVTGSPKGFWTGSDGTSAIVLTNGDAWVVFQDAGTANRLARIQTAALGLALSGNGIQYQLQSGSSETVSLAGGFVEKQSLTATMTAASGNRSLTLVYDARYETIASLADVTGSWSGLYGGVSMLTLTISSTGVLTGSSSTGCNYSGSLQPRSADPSVFDVRFTETCVAGTPVTLEGIATVNAAKTGLSFALVTVDSTQGALFAGTRQ